MKSVPIIILHGWGLSGERFAPLISEFRRHGYHVYAPDLPGFGKTEHPKRPWHLSDYAVWLKDYIDTHKLTHVILVGHSFGGRVSLVFQKMYPKSVRALILSGTPGFTPIPRKKLMLFIFLAKIGNTMFSLPGLTLFQDYVRRWYYYVVGAKEFFRAEGPMRQTFKNVVQEDLVPAMESITVPCLLLWGEYDIIVPPSIAEKMERVIPGAKLYILPESDHGVAYKQAPIFTSYVLRFLDAL